MRTKQYVLALAALAVFAVGTAMAAPQRGPRLESRIDVAQSSFKSADPLAMTFELANHGSESAFVLRWDLPQDGITSDIFEVTRNGQPVPYVGRLYKRLAPTVADYVEIKPGEALSAEIDVSSAYDMTEAGQYSIRFRTTLKTDVATRRPNRTNERRQRLLGDELLSGPEQVAAEQEVLSNEVSFWFDGLDIERSFEEPDKAIGGYTGCSTTQISGLQTAHANAITLADKSKQDLAAYPSGNTRFTYWFGAFNATRHKTVSSHFAAEYTAFTTKSVTYDCTCTDSAYAYVYPRAPYKIYLCKAFWSAPALGRDSKAGTLIHEMSHFTVVAGTQDYVYGATGAHNLAVSNPKKAIMNADNHEYFAEDQP